MTSKVVEFYKSKNVLLTGGTGFLGKLLIEKLLRTCEVSAIYLIVRPKKGLTGEARLLKLVDESIFEKLRKTKENFINKIHIIEGDLSKKKLGLSAENIELITNTINVVFHCGASLNMDWKLVDSVMANVRGTSELLDIVGEAKNLQAYIQVSTAYSFCCDKVIKETFYEPPIRPDLLIKMAEELRTDILDIISPGLVGQWPNFYIYSKAVAENLLLVKGKNIPGGLFRPAIVTSTAYEPFLGWTDNLYGPLGILLSSHCGILRVLRAKEDIICNTVPGDMCINALLCLAWDIDQRWRTSSSNYNTPVLNFSGKGSKLMLPVRQYADFSKFDYIPFKNVMWYQMLFMAKPKYNYLILKFFLHSIPAYVIDLVLISLNQKPKMRKLYAKLDRNLDVLCHFLINEWDIDNKNVTEFWNTLSENDKMIFNFDVNSIDARQYLINQLRGLKKYILKEDMADSKMHEQKYKRLTVLHYVLKHSLIELITYVTYTSLYNNLHIRKR